ncbi:transcriptional regulator, LuxR family [Sphingomonas sp. NFR04]|uniref:PAS domain-containing protein n=1 Tax=Sphingomonas sp. NFR04 TaxID=1566283 RepID=UPI0008EAEAF2|nr:PAS domain-containing protein [Sphingomonas sp. NFR04]SFI89740.1 transcriptional regulator, LuxR family [Sphingomonas sp. NFR04]
MDKHALLASIRLSPIASIVTDPRRPDNPIVAANTAFERLTGYGEAELLGRNCRILAGPGTEPMHSNALAHAIATATPQVVELTNYRKDGSCFRNAVMVAPVLGDDGDVLFFLGTQMEVGASAHGLVQAHAARRIACLTHQQRAVLHLMARGLRSRQIGAELGLAEKTIKMHRSALVRRLGVSTSGEAMRLAIEAGL